MSLENNDKQKHNGVREREAASESAENGNLPPTRRNRAPRFEHKPDSSKRRESRGGASHESQKSPKNGANRPQNRESSASKRGDNRRRMTNPRELVIEALMRIENGGFSNIVWDNAVNNSHLSNLDKMLATRIFYGTLSNVRLIDDIWSQIEPEMIKRADSVVKMALRSAMYQLVFLDRVPAYSIVSTTVEIVKRLRNRAASGYCNALLRKAVKQQESGEKLEFHRTGDRLHDFAIQYSLNDDLARLLIRDFADDAENIANSMLTVPRMTLRVNRSKTTIDAFTSGQIQVEPSKILPQSSCTVIARHDAIDAAIERGDVCVQDEAAQLAVLALGIPESWAKDFQEVHIWDACAGQGGKSFHLMDEIACDPSGRKYSLLCTDLYANKLDRLRDYQQKHFPEQHILCKSRDLSVGGSVPMAPFDVVLVDAPCSGLGVLRRHPEVKLTRTEEDIASLVILQRQILDNTCKHIRVGGILVYVVCTITREECELQVEEFLKLHPNYRPDSLPAVCIGDRKPCAQIKYLPHIDACDGFFIARFVRVS